MAEKDLMDRIISFAKRRGFVYPSSDIYGGFAGVYDYGPYGVELLTNIRNMWWREMVHKRTDVVGLEAAIFSSPRVWEASGHVGGGFSDPLVEDKKTNIRHRADHLLEEVGVVADERMSEEELNALFDSSREALKEKYPKADFSRVRKFEMLAKSNLGDLSEKGENPSYLRGETAQSTYINFKNVVDTTRMKVPFGIAQIGRVFRNEIAPRQFIFRGREFQQMEFQYFVHPDKAMEAYEKLKQERWQFYLDLGLLESKLRWKQHENLIFYAKDAWDIEYDYPIGFKELEGIHARSDYDLTQHIHASRQDLSYFDQVSNERFVPHVVEAAAGLDRLFLAVLSESYTEEEMDGEERTVLKINPALAPVKAAVFPLVKNKPELVAKAVEVYETLVPHMATEFDDNGNIGKRYRRQDEIGTPYCVTIDYDTLEGKGVTVRNRDTGEQERVGEDELRSYLTF